MPVAAGAMAEAVHRGNPTTRRAQAGRGTGRSAGTGGTPGTGGSGGSGGEYGEGESIELVAGRIR